MRFGLHRLFCLEMLSFVLSPFANMSASATHLLDFDGCVVAIDKVDYVQWLVVARRQQFALARCNIHVEQVVYSVLLIQINKIFVHVVRYVQLLNRAAVASDIPNHGSQVISAKNVITSWVVGGTNSSDHFRKKVFFVTLYSTFEPNSVLLHLGTYSHVTLIKIPSSCRVNVQIGICWVEFQVRYFVVCVADVVDHIWLF